MATALQLGMTTKVSCKASAKKKNGRPPRFSLEEKADFISEYEVTARGEKQELADRLGIEYKSLYIFIHRWRKQIECARIESVGSGSEPEPDGERADLSVLPRGEDS